MRPNSPRGRVIATLVLFLTIVPSCRPALEERASAAGGERCEGTGPVPGVTPVLRRAGGPYSAFLVGECGRSEGVLGTHCWSYGNETFCADHFGPAQPTQHLVVGRTEQLELEWRTDEAPQELKVEVMTWPDREALERAARAVGREPVGVGYTEVVRQPDVERKNPTMLSLDVSPARYLLQVDSTWSEGNGASYTFGVTVLPA